ncbi:MAG: histidine phosphatase family protein [Oscillospiraceae bacterium]
MTEENMVTYTLHLIRHGMTAGNRDGRYVGRTDLPLCDEGRTELETLRACCPYPPVEEVFCSPLLRCRQTAQILYPMQPLTPVDDLMELSMGDFEGKFLRDLKGSQAYRAWMTDSLHNTPPGALETGEQFARRTARALHLVFSGMTQRHVREAAVITHGGVLMGMLSAFALPRRPLRDWAVSNGTGYTISMTTEGWMRDGIVQVKGPLPLGHPAGCDARVMDSLGVAADE